MDWKGKTALITGGVSGIGFGIARALCAAGIDLILTYRNEDYRAEAEAWFELHARPVRRFVSLDVAAIHRDCVAALPNEAAPEARRHIERLRREANRAAAAGKVISLGDLTDKPWTQETNL